MFVQLLQAAFFEKIFVCRLCLPVLLAKIPRIDEELMPAKPFGRRIAAHNEYPLAAIPFAADKGNVFKIRVGLLQDKICQIAERLGKLRV